MPKTRVRCARLCPFFRRRPPETANGGRKKYKSVKSKLRVVPGMSFFNGRWGGSDSIKIGSPTDIQGTSDKHCSAGHQKFWGLGAAAASTARSGCDLRCHQHLSALRTHASTRATTTSVHLPCSESLPALCSARVAPERGVPWLPWERRGETMVRTDTRAALNRQADRREHPRLLTCKGEGGHERKLKQGRRA